MISRDFRPGAPIRNFVKDLDTVLATAKEIGSLNLLLRIGLTRRLMGRFHKDFGAATLVLVEDQPRYRENHRIKVV